MSRRLASHPLLAILGGGTVRMAGVGGTPAMDGVRAGAEGSPIASWSKSIVLQLVAACLLRDVSAGTRACSAWRLSKRSAARQREPLACDVEKPDDAIRIVEIEKAA